MQGAGSVASGVALHAAAEGARLIDRRRRCRQGARSSPTRSAATVVDPTRSSALEADVLSPNALGAILDRDSIAGAQRADRRRRRQQPARDAARTARGCTARGILYAPDYVINAGGIINVCTEYLGDGDASLVRERIEAFPSRLEQIWAESAASGRDPAAVADAMAQRLIGRGR